MGLNLGVMKCEPQTTFAQFPIHSLRKWVPPVREPRPSFWLEEELGDPNSCHFLLSTLRKTKFLSLSV